MNRSVGLSVLTACAVTLLLHESSSMASAQENRVEPDFSHGVHKDPFSSPDGPVRVFVVNYKHVRALFENESSGECPHGGKRTFYLRGQIQGSVHNLVNRSFSGTIYLCTDPKELVEECNLESVWKTKFTGKFINPYRIKITYQGEHYPRGDDGNLICTPEKYEKTIILKRPGMWKDILRDHWRKVKGGVRDAKQEIQKRKEELDKARDFLEDPLRHIREDIMDSDHRRN